MNAVSDSRSDFKEIVLFYFIFFVLFIYSSTFSHDWHISRTSDATASASSCTYSVIVPSCQLVTVRSVSNERHFLLLRFVGGPVAHSKTMQNPRFHVFPSCGATWQICNANFKITICSSDDGISARKASSHRCQWTNSSGMWMWVIKGCLLESVIEI